MPKSQGLAADGRSIPEHEIDAGGCILTTRSYARAESRSAEARPVDEPNSLSFLSPKLTAAAVTPSPRARADWCG